MMKRMSLCYSLWFGAFTLMLVATSPSANAQNILKVTASAGQTTPNWAAADGTDTAKTSLSASVSDPPTVNYSCILYGPNWFWTIDTVQYSADDSSWTPTSSGYSACIVQPDPSSAVATLYATFNEGGYWQISCQAAVEYDDDSCGDTWSGTALAMADAKSVKLIGLTVKSGAKKPEVLSQFDWAAVKTKAGDKVIIEASIQPDNQNAATKILWKNGSAVTGNAKQRSVDKGVSAKSTVRATIGLTTDTINIWILWATIQILTADPKPANAPNFGTTDDGTEHLGAVFWYDGSSAKAAGKICAVATITPVGVHAVVKTGWRSLRNRMSHDFNDGVKSADFFDTDWQDDSYPPGSPWTMLIPDANDKIYDIDAPTVAQIGNKDSTETYNNYRQYIQWNGETASDDAA